MLIFISIYQFYTMQFTNSSSFWWYLYIFNILSCWKLPLIRWKSYEYITIAAKERRRRKFYEKHWNLRKFVLLDGLSDKFQPMKYAYILRNMLNFFEIWAYICLSTLYAYKKHVLFFANSSKVDRNYSQVNAGGYRDNFKA